MLRAEVEPEALVQLGNDADSVSSSSGADPWAPLVLTGSSRPGLRCEGLKDERGRGRKRQYTDKAIERIVEQTLYNMPGHATHWSTAHHG